MIDGRNIMAIAKKEFMDNWRNKWIIAIASIFLILMLVISYFGSTGSQAGWRTIDATIGTMSFFVVFLISIISLMLGYASIVGEKEKGSLGVLLSYPVSRNEVIIGKFVGLSMVIIATILMGFGLAGLIIGINVGSINGKVYGIFLFSTILFGLSYLAVAILISTIFEKRSTAMGAVIFLWFFFAIIWSIIIVGILVLSGWNVVESHTSGYIEGYGNGTVIPLHQMTYSITYGDGNIYALGEKYIIEYNLSLKHERKIKNMAKNSTKICYGNNRLYIAGEKLWIYDLHENKWSGMNISCNDVTYGDGKIFILNYIEAIEYNISSGSKTNFSLPAVCYSITYGNHFLYFSSDKTIYQYNPDNGSWKEFRNSSIERIKNIEYADGQILIADAPSYILNISTGRFMELPFYADDIAYGKGVIYAMRNEKTYTVAKPPGWYYITDFFNPAQTYNGIMRLITNTTVSNILKESYPSFYNIYSLETVLLLWIVIPMAAAIYIFRKKDI